MTPKEWENFSDTNIAKAEEQKANSVSLRALVQSVLKQTFTDVQKQIQLTNAAFQLIVKEIKSAKSQMENKLAKVGQMSILKESALNEDKVRRGEGKVIRNVR